MRFLAVVLLALALLLPTAAAHKTAYTEDGSVKIVWGFLGEPAVTMTKTGLDLILTDNATGAPIADAHETLTASLRLGDLEHEFAGLRAQHGKPGGYTDVITLTRPGLYVLHLEGTIHGTAVSIDVPAAHEVAGIEETYFPPLDATDAGALAQRVAELEAKVAALQSGARAQSGEPAATGAQTNDAPALGALAALGAVGVVALLRRRA